MTKTKRQEYNSPAIAYTKPANRKPILCKATTAASHRHRQEKH